MSRTSLGLSEEALRGCCNVVLTEQKWLPRHTASENLKRRSRGRHQFQRRRPGNSREDAYVQKASGTLLIAIKRTLPEFPRRRIPTTSSLRP